MSGKVNLKKSSLKLLTAKADTQLHVVGQCELLIEIDPLKFAHNFQVIQNLQNDLILSWDFLLKFGAKLNFVENTFSICNGLTIKPLRHSQCLEKPIFVQAISSIHIKPRGTLRFQAQIRKFNLDHCGKTSVFFPSNFPDFYPVTGKFSIDRVDEKGQITCELMNLTNCEVTIPIRMALGRVEFLNHTDEVQDQLGDEILNQTEEGQG